mmetsp:Transcript_27617/g.89218  ORF Transcript_27617/g.89218 Transcript_27617/m.89218 type:complete len:218 (-) Transcript_27617:619-1272(-)
MSVAWGKGRRSVCATWQRRASARTRATMLSTMGHALGRTQGSWRPLPRSCVGCPSRVTVSWSWPMVDVGLKATLTTMVSPLEMPPWMPPDRFDLVRVRPSSSTKNSSLCSFPVSSTPRKPLPTSKPLAAGRERHALARSASSLSKTGEPRPAGTFLATHSTTPPMEFPVRRMASMRSIMRSATPGSGHRAMLASIDSRDTPSTSKSSGKAMSCTWRT